ncbi:alpha-beta hydrolase superfamily lysophospholipase [Catenuloplanes nepalensis]|uniref:Alpha-beta hydrolase superfamily lysophospholipase n=1 Tax=Catenuloplanes nepalensis TaxID=587533 RepID=A0ABT9MMZ3_9ACTN|nr:alpha/beta hydrolase [Catenuloplanes nepalensis]MDP9792795.1 alpha-beta hydrolase superfamily lysophospholipase [Catenuloplanes nepalensis]
MFEADGTDLLGVPYERFVLDCGRDAQGALIATLVRRRPDHGGGRRAVLMLGGLADYFFQTHVADHLAAGGWGVYGLDVRRYGRSLLPHQTPNFCRSLTEYYPELDAAVAHLTADGVREIVLWGHSTGGLIGSLWAADRPSPAIRGLFLNSPFLDFALPWALRRPAMAAVSVAARFAPHAVMPHPTSDAFAVATHATLGGEWSYDLALKPARGHPIRLGWLAAIRDAHRRVRRGLGLRMPVLVGSSDRSFNWVSGPREDIHRTDIVLDVAHIRRWGAALGEHVTLVRFPGALHDLTLSAPGVRSAVLRRFDEWAASRFSSDAPAENLNDSKLVA